MPLIAKDSGDFVLVPPGMHLSRCYRIVDLGTQKTDFQGKPGYKPRVQIYFEVHGEDENGKPLKTSDGRPLSIFKSYNVTLADKSTLRKDLQMWRKKEFTSEELRGFELKNVLGAWAMLTVVHTDSNGKTYANIASINPVPKTIKEAGLPEGANEPKIFEISNPDMALFDSFSEGLKNKIMSSPEWQESQGQALGPDGVMSEIKKLDDDIPF